MVFVAMTLVLLELLLRVSTWLLPNFIYRLFYNASKRFVTRPNDRDLMYKVQRAPGFIEMCAIFGYEVEEHVVKTEDGYLLGVHRVCRTKSELANKVKGRRPARVRKPVVYLHHGLMMTSEIWAAPLEENRQLLFSLVEAGYDVWLGNNRGNKYSKKHISLSPGSQQFWDFSIDQFALRDIPDTIAYILRATAAQSLSYIGFSQGTAQAFATLSIHPDLNEKINLFVALAPAMSPRTGASIANGLIKSAPALIFLFFGRKIILPSTMFWQSIIYPPMYVRLLDTCMTLLFGWKMENMTLQQKMASYYHLYSLTSVKVLVHWFQIIKYGRFQMYDDAVSHYHATFYRPASFPTKNISTPIVLLYGGSDSLVDIDVMLANLPDHTIAEEISHFEHLDFLWAQEVDKLVIPRVLHHLRTVDGSNNNVSDTRGTDFSDSISYLDYGNSSSQRNNHNNYSKSTLSLASVAGSATTSERDGGGNGDRVAAAADPDESDHLSSADSPPAQARARARKAAGRLFKGDLAKAQPITQLTEP